MITNIGGETAPNHRPGEIRLAGGALGFNWLPVFAAERLRLFESRGLRVSTMRMGSVDKATAAVRAGDADLAITPPEGAIADCVGGGRLRVVAGNVNRLPLSLVANPRIKAVEDLRGCKLGTSSMTEGTAIYTREILARHGLAYPGDYEFDVVGVHPVRWQALQDGRIDAAVQLVPLNFVAFDAGYTNLGEASDYIPDIVFTALVADIGWAAAEEEKILALVDALREATAALYDPGNDEALLPIVMEITGSDRGYARKALDYMREKSVFSRNLGIPAAAKATTLELMGKAGLLAPADRERAAATFDGRFVDPADAPRRATA